MSEEINIVGLDDDLSVHLPNTMEPMIRYWCDRLGENRSQFVRRAIHHRTHELALQEADDE